MKKLLLTLGFLACSLFAFSPEVRADACTGINMYVTAAEFRGPGDAQYGYDLEGEYVTITTTNGVDTIVQYLDETALSNASTSVVQLPFCGTTISSVAIGYKVGNLQNALPALYGGYHWSMASGHLVSVTTPQNPYPIYPYFFIERGDPV